MNPQGGFPGAAQPQMPGSGFTPMPQAQPFDPRQITSAIEGLKTDIVKEMDNRFAAYDKRFDTVDHVSNVLTEAQKAQQQAMERARMNQPQQQYQPKSYEQIRQDAMNDAVKEMERRQKEADQRFEADRQREANEAAELDRQLQSDIDALRRSGYLPPIGNPNDPNDAGKFAEDELVSRAATMETPAIDQVALELAERHRNNQYWDIRTKSYKSADAIMHPLAGKTAPVGNSSMTAPTNTFQGPTAAELRTMTMDQLSELAKTRGYGPVPISAQQSTPY